MANNTTFTTVLQGGPDNGLGSTLDTRVGTTWIKEITVSAGSRNKTFTLPDNSFLHSSNGFVVEKVSGIAQGVKIQIGDATTDGLYGTANAVSALGVYALTLTESAVSAKTVVVKVTASVGASAADITGLQINVTIIGGIRS